MKKSLLLFVIGLMSAIPVLAQSEESDAIIAEMAQKMADDIRNFPAFKEVTVINFTRENEASSFLGEYLAALFGETLLNTRNKTFTFSPMENLKTRNPNAWIDVLSVTSILLGANSSSNQPSSAAPSRTESTKYKKVDAIITGSFVEFSDYLELKVQLVNYKKKHVEATIRRKIPKNWHILELLEKEKTTNPASDPSKMASFSKDDLVFDLQECRQMGRIIECKFKISNRSREDIELTIHANPRESKIFSTATGNEFYISGIKMAELSDSDRVRKTIVSNGAIIAVITFSNVAETIDKASKVQLNCYSSQSRYFNAEFRGIPVKR